MSYMIQVKDDFIKLYNDHCDTGNIDNDETLDGIIMLTCSRSIIQYLSESPIYSTRMQVLLNNRDNILARTHTDHQHMECVNRFPVL